MLFRSAGVAFIASIATHLPVIEPSCLHNLFQNINIQLRGFTMSSSSSSSSRDRLRPREGLKPDPPGLKPDPPSVADGRRSTRFLVASVAAVLMAVLVVTMWLLQLRILSSSHQVVKAKHQLQTDVVARAVDGNGTLSFREGFHNSTSAAIVKVNANNTVTVDANGVAPKTARLNQKQNIVSYSRSPLNNRSIPALAENQFKNISRGDLKSVPALAENGHKDIYRLPNIQIIGAQKAGTTAVSISVCLEIMFGVLLITKI